MRESRFGSWLIFVCSIGLLGFVLWSRIFDVPIRGEWQHQLTGIPVGSLPVVNASGDEVQVSHPAVLYFYSSNCRFCPPAAERINAYLAREGVESLPMYALTNFGQLHSEKDGPFDSSIRRIRLTRTTRDLTFVEQVPLLVRTSAAGTIERAYVGIAADSILAAILVPRRAGPVAQ